MRHLILSCLIALSVVPSASAQTREYPNAGWLGALVRRAPAENFLERETNAFGGYRVLYEVAGTSYEFTYRWEDKDDGVYVFVRGVRDGKPFEDMYRAKYTFPDSTNDPTPDSCIRGEHVEWDETDPDTPANLRQKCHGDYKTAFGALVDLVSAPRASSRHE